MNTNQTQRPSHTTDGDDNGGSSWNPYLVAAGLFTGGLAVAVGAFVFGGADDDDSRTAEAAAAQTQQEDDADERTVDEAIDEVGDAADDAIEAAGSEDSDDEAAVNDAVSDAEESSSDVAGEQTDGADTPTAPDGQEVVDEAVTESADAVAEASEEAATDEPADPADDPDAEFEIVFDITQACATTHHSVFGDHPSYILWDFTSPTLEQGTEITVTLSSDGGPEQLSTVFAGHIMTEQGIDAYGPYPFPSLSWTDDDGHLNEITMDLVHVVDDKEGEPSMTCAV